MFSRPKLAWTLPAALCAFLLDIGSKWLALRHMELGEVREVGPFFSLVLVMNSGAAFSLFSGSGGGQGLKMAALSAAALIPVAFLWHLAQPGERLRLVSLGAIFGGAFGNIADRARFGAVVDFLDFHAGSRHWPAFNLADAFVVLGLALFFLSLLPPRGEKAPAPPDSKAGASAGAGAKARGKPKKGPRG